MNELDRFVHQLNHHQMFVNINNNTLRELKKRKIIIGYRNDAAGARIMCLVNLIRISRKLKKDFLFYWDTSYHGVRFGKKSKEEIIQMKSNDHIFNYLPNFKKNIRYFDSEKKIVKNAIKEWRILFFKGENKKNVIKQMKRITEEVFYNHKISSINNFRYKTGINIRLGDITAFNNRINNKRNYYNYDFNLSKWYPESMWQEIFNKIKNRVIIGTNDYYYLKNNFKLSKNFHLLDKKHQKKENTSLKFLKDIIAISKCDLVICSLKSGTGMLLGLLSKKVETPETYLKIEKIYFDFYKISYSQFKTLSSIKHTISHLFKHLKFMFRNKLKIFFISIRSIVNI